jgi:hypothetical protein
MNAKYFLDKSLRLLFRPDAAEEAMKNGQPALAATGQEPQFTAGVMARLFPRPILSPEYKKESILFRMKAPDATQVFLVTEYQAAPLAMQRDNDGVWEVEIRDHIFDTFTYYFLVDGTPVADPQNMYLAPTTGFKPSICQHPSSTYSFAGMGQDIPHGKVRYHLKSGAAFYLPANLRDMQKQPFVIQLQPGKNDTAESWFKIGGADAITDKLMAEGRCTPCILTTGFLKKVDKVLRADDFNTWQERREALESLLLSIK